MKNTLAVVRCGDSSLHRTWTETDLENRDFDVAVSYFGSDDTKEFPEATYVHRKRAGKWDGIYDFFKQHPQALEEYEYFWLPDDDIRSSASDVNEFISLASQCKMTVAQPSLSRNSYFSHLVTLNHSSYIVRYTNFVEIMVPLVHRDFLARSLSKFAKSKSGFGLDVVWGQWAKEDQLCIGIIDAVQVEHTRPIGGELHKKISDGGGSSQSEMGAMFEGENILGRALINGHPLPRIKVLGGKLKNGRVLRSRSMLTLSLFKFGFASFGRLKQPTPLRAFARYALKHLTK